MTFTQHMIAEFEKAQSIIISNCNIDDLQYSEIIFNLGDQFAQKFSEKRLNQSEVYELLVYTANTGFWNWWKAKFHLDDIQLLKQSRVYETPYEYALLKACMIGDTLLEDDLFMLVQHLL